MQRFFQGNGETTRFTALGPTQRKDGSALNISDISHFIRFFEYDDGSGPVAGTPMDVQLVDDANTPEYDGVFDEIVDVDTVGIGIYTYWYRTVDTGGRQSAESERVSIEVLPPIAAPNPPTNVSVIG